MRTLIFILFLSTSCFAQDQKYIDDQIEWLKIYTDSRFESVNKAVDKVAITNENAITKVETTYSDYRMQQNEWRGQIKDANATFVTRSELWAGLIATISITISVVGIMMRRKEATKTR
jgi:hypothetical protein